jgi:hypothetical protein
MAGILIACTWMFYGKYTRFRYLIPTPINVYNNSLIVNVFNAEGKFSI